jgi:hypothetical protein
MAISAVAYSVRYDVLSKVYGYAHMSASSKEQSAVYKL